MYYFIWMFSLLRLRHRFVMIDRLRLGEEVRIASWTRQPGQGSASITTHLLP